MPARIRIHGKCHIANHTSLVYCIAAGTESYVGLTNNLLRRLRQHNGELTHGARYTTRKLASGAQWHLHFIVTGFHERRHAAQLEKRLHGNVTLPQTVRNPFSCATPSQSRRAWQLYWALRLERLYKKSPPINQLGTLTVYWKSALDLHAALYECPHPWPSNVRHVLATRDTEGRQ